MEELRVVITADASAVPAAVAQATGAVQASADQIAAAQTTAKVATQALAEAQKQLGAAAIAGNAQAASVISEYAQASASATAALEALTSAQNQNTASTEANTVAQERDTAVTYNRMEAMGSARIAMGALDGSTSMMAGGLARLVAGSATLGPLLASLVPYAAIAAGVFLLVDLVKGIEKFATDAENLANELNTDWLTGAIGQMDGLKDAIEQADKATAQYQKDIDAETDKANAAQIENIRLTQGQAAAYRAMAAEKLNALRGANPNIVGGAQGALDADLAEQKRLQAASQFGARPDLSPGEENKQRIIAVQQLASITEKIEGDEAEIARLTQEAANYDIQAAQVKEKKVKADNLPEQIAKAQVEAAHAADAELNPAQQVTAELQKQVSLDAIKAQFSKDGTAAERDQLRQLEDLSALGKANSQVAALEHEAIVRDFEEQLKAQDEVAKRAAEQQKAEAEAYNKTRDAQIEAARETASVIIDEANLEFERTQQQIHSEEELGFISHRVAEQRLLDALKLRESTTQGALKDEQGLFDPALGQKQAIQYGKLQEQMTREAQRAASERERIVQQETLKIEQMYKKVANAFNTDFERAFNQFALGQKSSSQAFGQMLGQMELQVVDFAAKTILEHAEMWAEIKIMNALGIETVETQNTLANLKQVTQDAKVTAANAYKWASSWGGPPAGAIAAAVAFARVEALGVFDTGGMLPHMGYAFNSSGSPERVLSPSQTQNFESMVNNGGSSTRSAVLHQTNNFGGGVTPEMLQAHTNQTMSRLRAMIRPEAFR